MTLLVTGGCGFIGSNFIRFILKHRADCEVVNLDALTYAGNQAKPAGARGDVRYRFVHGRIEDPAVVKDAMTDVDAVIHFAARPCDRSIDNAAPFITTNVLGTQVMLEAARRPELGASSMSRPTRSTVPWAMKVSSPRPRRSVRARPIQRPRRGRPLGAGVLGDYRLPVMVVRPSNNYGPYQFPEKLIPVMVTNLVEGRKVPVYGRGENVRDWLHVDDCCRAIELVLDRGRPGEAYNIGGQSERRNIEVVSW